VQGPGTNHPIHPNYLYPITQTAGSQSIPKLQKSGRSDSDGSNFLLYITAQGIPPADRSAIAYTWIDAMDAGAEK